MKTSTASVAKALCACLALVLLLTACGDEWPTSTRASLFSPATATPLPTEPPPPPPLDTPVATSTLEITPTPTPTPEPPNTPTPSPTPSTELTGAQVVEVVDGDTIKVDIDGTTYTVRYIGIDTPETKHPSEPVQWMGPEATAANRRLVDGKTILLERGISNTDQYRRLLRYVYVGDLFVNEELVRQGFAQVRTYPPDVKSEIRS
jgi:micrococcal nuclease